VIWDNKVSLEWCRLMSYGLTTNLCESIHARDALFNTKGINVSGPVWDGKVKMNSVLTNENWAITMV
jgi:hypothetical protein